MLKTNQCWRCDTICSPPTSKISCPGCGVASYCSNECKHSDAFRHQVDCQTAALKKKCAGCGKEETGLKPCGSCRQVWYCDKNCQKKSWPTHKAHCQLVRREREELSHQLKVYYDHMAPGTGTVYYWGNIPAVDLINLPLNEGVLYNKPMSILACGVGDPRSVLLSLSHLPNDYNEELTFVLNDICPCVMARTVLILYMLTKGGGKSTASSLTQIWYSLRLSEDDYKLLISTLQELIHAPSLEELSKGTMKIELDHFQRLKQVWRTWFDLSRREGDWITEARRKRIENDPHSEKGNDLYLEQIPKEHKKSAFEWLSNGILLPKESRKELPRENVTLTGSPAAFIEIGLPYPFSYIMDPSVLPFTSWDYKDAKQHSHCASLLEMYSQYVGHVLDKSAVKIATGQVKFHFLLCNCMEMAPFLPPDLRYDRVATSNIADYVPLTRLLGMSKPLLNKANPSAVIITEFMNWQCHTNLHYKVLHHFSQLKPSFLQKVLGDTQNPAIANSKGRVAFMDYHDYSDEFIQFLRAALLVTNHEFSDARNRLRTWSAVADHNGLVARDFLRSENRVFPAKWIQNCRRVTRLSGFERAVEWIISRQ